MTVAELIVKLQALDPSATVCLADDDGYCDGTKVRDVVPALECTDDSSGDHYVIT